MAQNLTGNYWLFPSDNFGRWLRAPELLSQSEVVDYVGRIGGSRAILNEALAAHRKLDGFKALRPFGLREYRAVVGTGVATITGVRFDPAAGKTSVDLSDGDGTVPSKSASQGAITTGKPLGAHVPISYLCGIDHVPLGGGDPKIFNTFGDYIRYGTPPHKTAACTWTGVVTAFTNVDSTAPLIGPLPPASAASAPSSETGGLSKLASAALVRAELDGLGETILLPQQAYFIADAHHPGTVASSTSSRP